MAYVFFIYGSLLLGLLIIVIYWRSSSIQKMKKLALVVILFSFLIHLPKYMNG